MALRLKSKDIPDIKFFLLREQGFRCPICDLDMSSCKPKDIVLDHDHKTGAIRAVLCRNCNAIQGRIWNFANRAKREETIEQWLIQCLQYVKEHAETDVLLYHPTYKTPEEKRIARNKKAKSRRKKKKESSSD